MGTKKDNVNDVAFLLDNAYFHINVADDSWKSCSIFAVCLCEPSSRHLAEI